MKIATKIKHILWICVILSGISGCSLYPDGTINSVEEGTMQVSGDESRHMQGQLNGSVSVDADIVIPEDIKWKQYMAEERQFTKEEAGQYADLFLFDTQITDIQETPYKYIYTYSDKSSFYVGSGSFSYRTEESEKRNYNLYISGKGKYWTKKEEAFPLEELEGVSLNNAVNQVRNLCEKMRVELSEEEPEVYVMDAEHMTDIMLQSDTLHYYRTKEQSINGEQGQEITWEKKDEVYYLIFEMNLESAPLSNKSIQTDSIYASQSQVIAVIGRDGLKELRAGDYLYSITEEQELEGSVCSSSEALEILASTYQYMDGLVDMTLMEMKLVYVPMGTNGNGEREYKIRPYWMCTMLQEKASQKGGETEYYESKSVTIIDAVSKAVYKATNSQ